MKTLLHIIPNIYVKIAVYGLVMVYAFVVIGTALVPVFGGNSYFKFGAPLTIQADPTSAIVISDNAIFVATCLLLGLDQFVGVFVDELALRCVGEGAWAVLGTLIGAVQSTVRVAIHVVFVRSQISFVLSVVFFDLCATVICKSISLAHKRAGYDFRKFLCEPDALALVLVVRALSLLLYMGVYVATGLLDSPYFQVGPPLIVFDQTAVTEDSHYWMTVTVVFAWALISAASRHIAGRWHLSILQNTGETDAGMRGWTVTMVVFNRVVSHYLGLMFIYTFITTQFLFVVVFFMADVLVICGSRIIGAETKENLADSVIVVTATQTTFVVVVAITIGITRWFDDTYFEWGQGVSVFGVAVPESQRVTILLVYAALEQIASVLETNVVLSDVTTWLYSGSPNAELSSYGHLEAVALISITRILTWYYFVLRIQFILTNYAFVVICAAVELPIVLIVDHLHVIHKTNARQIASVREFLGKTA
jgi:hypothetical protein